MGQGPNYTPEEDRQIADMLKLGYPVKLIAAHLDRPLDSVTNRKKKLGLHCEIAARRERLLGEKPMSRGTHSFKQRLWTAEEDEIVRQWSIGNIRTEDARKAAHCHSYYLHSRALELGLSIPERYRTTSRIRGVMTSAELNEMVKPEGCDGRDFTCTVGKDPLLSALRKRHPERAPA